MGDKWMDDRERAWLERERGQSDTFGSGEDRTWDRDRPGRFAAHRSGLGRDPVFGERESGASYGAGRALRPAPRFTSQDYTGGGRFYGDDSHERIYREEYGQGGHYYGEVPRGYDAGRGYGGASERQQARTDRFEGAGRGAGEFLHRAGERVASWLSAGQERPQGARGLGPKGYKRSDERIGDDVHERLTEDAWLDASGVIVSVSEGEVTLSGSVESREAKHRAERIVEDVSGVVHVQNNLRQADGRSFGASSDDAVANGSGGSGAGQSTAGRKE